MSTKPAKHVRVFAIESPGPLDLLADRTESQTLQAVCKLLGHEFAPLPTRSRTDFLTALKLITSMNVADMSEESKNRPLCLHISAHGNEDGLGFGGDSVNWKPLAETLWKFTGDMSDYPGEVIFVLSACSAAKQKVTDHFSRMAREQPEARHPLYLFATVGDEKGAVGWEDAVVAWSIFYHQIGAAVLTRPSDIRLILDKIKLVGAGTLKYFRWDGKTKTYPRYQSDLAVYTRKVRKKPKPKPKNAKVNSSRKRGTARPLAGKK